MVVFLLAVAHYYVDVELLKLNSLEANSQQIKRLTIWTATTLVQLGLVGMIMTRIRKSRISTLYKLRRHDEKRLRRARDDILWFRIRRVLPKIFVVKNSLRNHRIYTMCNIYIAYVGTYTMYIGNIIQKQNYTIQQTIA